jgi:hypothetical protein
METRVTHDPDPVLARQVSNLGLIWGPSGPRPDLDVAEGSPIAAALVSMVAYDSADPGVRIRWSEIRRGVWEARCICTVQYHHEPVTDGRVRNDSLKIGHRGAPQCELHAETDPAMLRLALKIVDKDGYWWVQCSTCDTAWQVPFYVESVGS